MKFGHLIENNKKNIFLQNSRRNWGREALVELCKNFLECP